MEIDHQSDLRDLYDDSKAQELGLDFSAFHCALAAIGDRLLPPNTEHSDSIAFYRSLHLNDLALAQPCDARSASAWNSFYIRFREYLYATAMLISRSEQIARELSDSVAGELFVGEASAKRGRSKMASYSGRGSLEGWLRALISHAYIDQYRSEKRSLSLDGRLLADCIFLRWLDAEADRDDLGDSRIFCAAPY
jgi:hypothetical protein